MSTTEVDSVQLASQLGIIKEKHQILSYEYSKEKTLNRTIYKAVGKWLGNYAWLKLIKPKSKVNVLHDNCNLQIYSWERATHNHGFK